MNAIKKFFAPSLEFFTWGEIKQNIFAALGRSRELVGKYFRLFWWVMLASVVAGLGMVAFLFKNDLLGKKNDIFEMILAWARDKESIAFVGLIFLALFFFLLMMFLFSSQLVFVRMRNDQELSLKKIFKVVLSHYHIAVVMPVFLVFSSLSLLFGDFYAFRFFESPASWRSLRKSVWSGMKLGLALFPLKFAIYLVVGVVIVAVIAASAAIGFGLWWLAQLGSTFYMVSVCLSVPVAVVALYGFGWSFLRGIFFGFAMQTILYDNVKQRLPDLLPPIIG